MAGRRTTLAAVLLLGLCASAMAGSPGSRKLQAAAARQPWDASKSADSINSGFAAVFNAAKDIELQARMKTTPANLYSAAGRTLLQRESPKTEDSTFKMNDASSNIIKMQQRLSSLAARGGRVLLQRESPKTEDSTFKMNDASSNIIKMQQRLSSLAARGGRVLLQSGRSTSDRMTQNTIKINAAADLVHQATTRMMSKVKSRLAASDAKLDKASNKAAAQGKAQ